jgi:hypothetical protein
MTSIKPPSKPSVAGVDSKITEGVAGGGATSGPSFRERVGESQAPTRAQGAGATGGADPTRAVVSDLQAGKISPNEAVSRLTEAAMQRNRVPPAMRAAVETQVREFLQRDPVVAELMRTMGASLQSMDK